MTTPITFCDLRHTGHSCNTIPFAAGLVAAAAKNHFGDRITVQIFKDPVEFCHSLETSPPSVACFSNYVWNARLSYGLAERIKDHCPDTTVVFGGPNFPVDPWDQDRFVRERPAVDFFVFREGERAIVGLLEALFSNALDAGRVKRGGTDLGNCLFLEGGEVQRGPVLPRIEDLDETPSPYLTGLMDRFLAEDLIPLFQTTRGCPFSCAYCQEGEPYFNPVRRFSPERLRNELDYMGARTSIPNLIAADSNFGMYRNDLETCRSIALAQDAHGWPQYFVDFAGKNKKDRVLRCVSMIAGSHHLSAAVQSTDEQVLAAVKRENVSLEQMVKLAKESEALGANSFAEVILALPMDTHEAHFRSMLDMVDGDLNVVRSHQFIMLPGAHSSTQDARAAFGLQTRFRVVPNTAAEYHLFGRTFTALEIDEICVASDTLSFQDYLDCRLFNLTVEIFYNNGIFTELLRYLRLCGVTASKFLEHIHQRVKIETSPLAPIYTAFLRESQELWEDRAELEQFLAAPGNVEKYRNGELGNNEQVMYRGIAIFRHMEDIHRLAFATATDLVACTEESASGYLAELLAFSLATKVDLFSTGQTFTKRFRYDFAALQSAGFTGPPHTQFKREGVTLRFAHSEEQQERIAKYIGLFGLTDYGLGNILSNGGNLNTFYRSATRTA